MISMHGVPSSLIARNESWVRKQAQALVRRLPSNVEKADLIQVGLIAVAQAAISFEWEGDRDTEEAKEAFVRYARMRVKGAMLDELRQMDHLGRAQRRKIKVVQIARERWRAQNGAAPTLTQLSEICGLEMSEIARLDQADEMTRTESTSDDDDGIDDRHQAATPREEVEARVDTGIVMRRLERFFAELPERDRMVIDSYLGVGLTPVQLAASLNVSPSRVSQLFSALVRRAAVKFGQTPQRSTDRARAQDPARFADMMAKREAELAHSPEAGAWGELMEQILAKPRERFGAMADEGERISVTSTTRWM